MTIQANNVSTITPAVSFQYSTEDIRNFVEGTKNIGGNFQKYITGIIEDKQVSVLLDYANEEFAECEGDTKAFNASMSILRVQLGRACEALGMPKYTIKKVDGEFAFVPVKVKVVDDTPADDTEGDTAPTSDSLHSEAARLMATFMNNRTLDNAAKVTEFMLGLVS